MLCVMKKKKIVVGDEVFILLMFLIWVVSVGVVVFVLVVGFGVGYVIGWEVGY